MSESIERPVRTKLVATVGPACRSEEMIRMLVGRGVDVFRLNFSHGSLDEHGEVYERIRVTEKQAGRSVAVLGDLCGPKIRLDEIYDEADGGMRFEVGDTLEIYREERVGGGGKVSTNYDQFTDEVEVGHRVLIDDGLVRFIATGREEGVVRCRCTAAGVIRTRKGINLPDSRLTVGTLTEHDKRCVEWAAGVGLDYLALSFVRRAEELRLLRQRLTEVGSRAHLIAKIEKPEALKEIEEIIDASNGLMVARGDLGVEMDLARVPMIQKKIIRKCRESRKPVIVATQMLQSMIESATPTRAEVSDVSNAIFDGADGLMLSGETAVGMHVKRAIGMMEHIVRETEEYLHTEKRERARELGVLDRVEPSVVIARSAWQYCRDMPVDLVVVCSRTANTPRVFSKLRFGSRVVGMSDDVVAIRRMNLYYGVIPVLVDFSLDDDGLVENVVGVLKGLEMVKDGNRIVVIRDETLTFHKVGA